MRRFAIVVAVWLAILWSGTFASAAFADWPNAPTNLKVVFSDVTGRPTVTWTNPTTGVVVDHTSVEVLGGPTPGTEVGLASWSGLPTDTSADPWSPLTSGYSYIWRVYEVAADGHFSGAQVTSGSLAKQVWRFYNVKTSTHFYTADPAEKANIEATLASTYDLDGDAYVVKFDWANRTTLWRFYNLRTGTHFYTADPAEKANLEANMRGVFQLDGPAYKVSRLAVPGGKTVWRFFNLQTGTHFYTADPAEKASVEANLKEIYKLDGAAFYLAP